MIKSHLTVCIVTLIISIGNFLPKTVLAETVEATHKKTNTALPALPTVIVTATRPDRLTASSVLDKSLLDVLPSNSGNITEQLIGLPGVQTSESHNSSRQGGEIRPPELSISGGRPQGNNYLFDGVTNNNLLDPDFTDFDNLDNVQGHSQSLFILDHLINDVSVLTGNIPARYGNFTGGVVEMNSIDPNPEFGGEVSVRGTRSDWGQFYIDPDEETEEEKAEEIEKFKNSTSAANQPSFNKYQGSATIHVPINKTTGLVFDYSRTESSIPLTLLGAKKVQRRKNENFFLKTVIAPSTKTKLSLSATYAPYTGDYFKINTLHSDYTLHGGGYKFQGKLENNLNFGQVETNLSYQQSENSRTADPDWYSWRATDSKPWGRLIDKTVSLEGGHGDIEKTQKTLVANIDVNFNSLQTGSISHWFNLGGEIDSTHATFDKKDTSTQYISQLADGSDVKYPSVTCPAGMTDCIDGEQFIFSRTIRPNYKATADINTYSAYIQDDIELNRLNIRPGLRITYDDYQHNTNYEPRFAASLDIFGNKKTVLIGGANRYYGGNLLTLKLDEGKARTLYWQRSKTLTAGEPVDWDTDDITTKTFIVGRASDLKTPYSDEITLGLQQSLLGGRLDLLYTDRKFREQIVTVRFDKDPDDDGIIYKEWRNSGERNHDEFTISWQRSWTTQHLYIGGTWQETKSNSSSYNDQFAEHQIKDETDDIEEMIWYNDKLMSKSDLPVPNYNRGVSATLVYTIDIPYGFTISNKTYYRGRYKKLEDTKENIDADDDPATGSKGKETDIYADVTKRSALTFDWRIAWQSNEWRGNSLLLTLDVLNAFNRRITDGTRDGEYLLGRQYWAGLTYKF